MCLLHLLKLLLQKQQPNKVHHTDKWLTLETAAGNDILHQFIVSNCRI